MIPNIELSEKQGEAFQLLRSNLISELGYGGGANGGKSWLGCFWLANNCYEYPGSKWVVGRKELKALRESTLLTFFKLMAYYGIKHDFKYIRYNFLFRL